MAQIERITLQPAPIADSTESSNFIPGLRITVRTTTASLSDYPEWRLEDLRNKKTANLVTDGACS